MGPQINIIGSFFPSWMLCALIGIGVALLGRWLFVRTGLDPYVGPRGLVYSSLGIFVMLTLWVVFFRG
jgi:YtcA family